MQKIVVIGGKGTAVNVAHQILDASRRFAMPVEVLGFAIDDPSLGASIAGLPILCKPREAASRFESADVQFIYALYRPDKMEERTKLLHSYGIDAARFATFVHPLAYVCETARVGKGSVIFSNASIHHNAVIGDCGIVNAGAVVEHDTCLGDNCFVSACACIGSEVVIAEGVFVGLHATIREHVKVGAFAFIGMGAVVIRDVSPRSLVYGVPARARC